MAALVSRAPQANILETIGGERFIEKYRPTEMQESILDVDFAEHVSQARDTLILDAEGTFTETGAWDVSQEIIDKLAEAREQGIQNIAIATNMKPKTLLDAVQLVWWARSINADAVFFPLTPDQRKPSPYLLTQALARFNAKQEQALMIGDKDTADVAAANHAGIYSIGVDRLGKYEAPGDRYFRRPAEWVIRLLQTETEPTSTTIAQRYPAKGSFDYGTLKLKDELPEWFPRDGLIDAISDQPTQPDVDLLELMPPNTVADLQRAMANLKAPLGSPKFKQFMSDHGGKIADGLTYARIPLAIVTAILILAGKKKAALATYAAAQATDLGDGWAIRQSDEDLTSEYRIKMGKFEANVDKFLAFVVGAALVKTGAKSKKDFLGQQAREVARIPQREIYSRKGLNTCATRAGKNSTTALGGADGLSIIVPGRGSDIAQHVATAWKWQSLIMGPREWRYRQDWQARGKAIMALLESEYQDNSGIAE